MAHAPQSLLAAVARRLEEDPEHVRRTLELIADPDAVAEADDEATVGLARTVNAQRLAARWERFVAGSYTTGDVRRFLGGVSRQAVAQRVAGGRLFAGEVGGRLRFPDWQFGPEGPYRGLAEVIAALAEGGHGPLAADALMRGPIAEEEGRTPAVLLAGGDVDLAVHYLRAAGGGF